jgi:hypothetical protein
VFKLSKKSIAAGSAILVLAGGGIAYAYWTSDGTGSGIGAVSDGETGAIDLTTATITGLAPGKATADLTVTATNNATADQSYTLEYIELDKGTSGTESPVVITLADGVTPGGDLCKAAWFTPTVTPGTSPVALAKGASASFGTLKVSMPEDNVNNQNACKGANITVKLKAAPKPAAVPAP